MAKVKFRDDKNRKVVFGILFPKHNCHKNIIFRVWHGDVRLAIEISRVQLSRNDND